MSNPIGHKPAHNWTGKGQPWTLGNEAIHAEIAASQVLRWTPAQIKAAEKAGYFTDLYERAKKKRYGSLLEDEEEML